MGGYYTIRATGLGALAAQRPSPPPAQAASGAVHRGQTPVSLMGASSLREDAKPCTTPATPQHPYPPASRGREWNFPIPHSPRAGRTLVRSGDRLGKHQLSYPPASRGREWNFTIPLSPRAGRTRVHRPQSGKSDSG